MLTELKNRGAEDVLIVCCDGLKGLPDAIEATWPQATTQTCVIHLLRASFRYAGNDHRKKVAAALKPVYTAPSVEAAEAAFAEFEAGLGQRYPAIGDCGETSGRPSSPSSPSPPRSDGWSTRPT